MKKIPTIFQRDWNAKGHPIINEPNPDALWVFLGEGEATRKYDGTSCLVDDGDLWKRRELNPGDKTPDEFRLAGEDNETGKRVGWVPVGYGPEDKFHRMAFCGLEEDGTYELCGPKVQGNPENFDYYVLILHKYAQKYENVSTDFFELKSWLSGRDIEGLVWHHPDGRMAKIKLRDYGLKRTKTKSSPI
jgi:hypothetical protein